VTKKGRLCSSGRALYSSVIKSSLCACVGRRGGEEILQDCPPCQPSLTGSQDGRFPKVARAPPPPPPPAHMSSDTHFSS
jgi:hypothetical protein